MRMDTKIHDLLNVLILTYRGLKNNTTNYQKL